MKYAFLTAVFILLTAMYSHGDVLEVTGGESFSGTVVRIVEGTLVFKSSIAGQVMVPMDSVAALSTDHHLMLTRNDGEIIYGRLGHSDSTNLLTPLGSGEPRPINLAAIEEGVIIPNSADPKPKPSPPDWSASATVGALLRGGSQGTLSPSTHLDLRRDGVRSSFQSEVLVTPGSEEDFPEYLRGSARLNGVGEGSSPYIEMRVDRNTDASLRLRSELNLGLRWPILQNQRGSIETFAGFSAAYEQWEQRQRFLVGGVDLETEEEEVNLHLGLRYAEGGFRAEVALYPSLEEVGEFRVRANGSYSHDITPSLGLRLDLLIDYDSDLPYSRMSAWEAAFGASVELGF